MAKRVRAATANATLEPGPAPGLELAPPQAKTIVLVQVADIHVPASNPRIAQAEDAAAADFDALVDNIRRHGQLQPIGVIGDDPRSDAFNGYALAWGSRRLRAMRQLGATEIQAVVLPAGADAAEIAAAENLHRRAMTPLEEAIAVESMLQRHADKPASEAHAAVAAALGKSASWVRDRVFLARLCPEAREQVNTLELPLGHARELAKVADPRTQAQILKDWMRRGELPNINWARQECHAVALSLHQVPWQLDASDVARGRPACSNCEHNSEVAARGGLFEHDDRDAAEELGNRYRYDTKDPLGRSFGYGAERPKGPFCLNHQCFDAKAKAAREALAKASKAAAKAKKPAERIEAAAQAVPEWVEPKAVAAVAQPATKKGAGDKAGAPRRPTPQEERAAEKRAREARKRRAEREQARRDATARVAESLLQKPLALTAIAVLTQMGRCSAGGTHPLGPGFSAWSASERKRHDKLNPKVQALLNDILSGHLSAVRLDAMVVPLFAVEVGTSKLDEFLGSFGPASRAWIEEKLGIAEPKAEAAAPQPKAPAKKAGKGGARGKRASK